MSPAAPTLDATFKARALPAGSARFWSQLFAAPEARPALLGVYALSAEWSPLLDPETEPAVAHTKLGWWQEEMLRLASGKPLHPISVYLAAQPRAAPPLFAPLVDAARAAILEASGVPLERAADLQSHAAALLAGPLRVAARLTVDGSADDIECTAALAVGEYLSRARRDYRRAARHGRVPFAVDELLAAGIDNAALAAPTPSAALHAYLEHLRARALQAFAGVATALPPPRAAYRHLAVLSALGAERLRRDSATRRAPLKDMLLAWAAARRIRS
jgi:phytoene synthase